MAQYKPESVSDAVTYLGCNTCRAGGKDKYENYNCPLLAHYVATGVSAPDWIVEKSPRCRDYTPKSRPRRVPKDDDKQLGLF